MKEETSPLGANDQVNRDAEKDVPNSETVTGGSGSTFCSPLLSGRFSKAPPVNEVKQFIDLFGMNPNVINEEVTIYVNSNFNAVKIARKFEEYGIRTAIIEENNGDISITPLAESCWEKF